MVVDIKFDIIIGDGHGAVVVELGNGDSPLDLETGTLVDDFGED